MDAATRLGIALLWLLPCAWYDWRTRRVPNALTVPAFFLAWPIALWQGPGALALTGLALWLGWWGWRMGWMGGADVKALTFVTALAPEVLVGSVPLRLGLILWHRSRGLGHTHAPELVVLALSAVLTVPLIWMI